MDPLSLLISGLMDFSGLRIHVMGLVWVGDRGTCPPPMFLGVGDKRHFVPPPMFYGARFLLFSAQIEIKKIKSFQIAKIYLIRAPKPGVVGYGPSHLACVPSMISRQTRPSPLPPPRCRKQGRIALKGHPGRQGNCMKGYFAMFCLFFCVCKK